MSVINYLQYTYICTVYAQTTMKAFKFVQQDKIKKTNYKEKKFM